MIMIILEQDTMNAVKNYCNSKANIDWEQRRYEIAKEIFLSLQDSQRTYEEDAELSIEVANIFIAKLKKQK